MFVGFGWGYAVRFGSNLLLTRLLVPDMFGLMTIANIVMTGLYMFSDLGLQAVIVRSRRGDDPVFINTVWTVQIFRGLLLWLVALSVALALFVAARIGMVPKNSVYADPRLPFIIIGVSFGLVIMAFASTKSYEAYRRLAIGRVTLMELFGQLANFVGTLAWVIIDRSVWALVAGNICSTLVVALVSHIWLPGTPNRFKREELALQEVLHFGKWIFISSGLYFLARNCDRLILGGLTTSTVLGVSIIPYMIVGAIEAIVLRSINSVLFPVLSEIVRERPNTLKANYYRMHTLVSAFCYFCSGCLMVSGQALIGLLYNRHYADAGWMLEILAAVILTYPFQIAIQAFTALGMPNLQSYAAGNRLIVLVSAVPLGFYFFGVPGALWGSVLSQFLSIPLIIYYSLRHGFFGLREELLPLPMVFVGAAAGKLLSVLIAKYHGV